LGGPVQEKRDSAEDRTRSTDGEKEEEYNKKKLTEKKGEKRKKATPQRPYIWDKT